MQSFVKGIILLSWTSLFIFVGTLQAAGSLPKNARIAIVGAGASGLTAAHSLKKQGYENITVFEKDERIGGKVYSVAQSNNIYEVGAFWAGNGYAVVDELAAEYAVKFQTEEIAFTVKLADGNEYSLADYLQKTHNVWQLTTGFYNWQKVQKKFAYLLQAGSFFQEANPDLTLPFVDFAKKYHIEVFAQGFRPFWIGCGYGYYEETPAIYVLKLMLGSINIKITDLVKSFLPFGNASTQGLRRAPEGYQQIWIRLAQDLDDVRTGHTVDKVVRRVSGTGFAIDITSNGATETYDALIVSTDPRQALQFLDASAAERELFGQVESYEYVIHLFEAKNLPYKDGSMVFLDAYGVNTSIGHTTALVNRAHTPQVWTAGQLVSWGTPIDQVTETLRQDVKDLGGNMGEVYQRIEWNYFPHVKSAGLRAGFYKKFKALQGQKSTWYVGGLMNFETVENTAGFAKQLIQQEF